LQCASSPMGQDAAKRTSLNQRRSSCFARSASLSLRPQLSAPPLSLRPRHRPGDAAEGSAATMADFMRDGAIAVSDTATAAARAGAISIRTAASDRRQHRDYARLLRRGRVIHCGSCLPVIRECLLTEEHLSPPPRTSAAGMTWRSDGRSALPLSVSGSVRQTGGRRSGSRSIRFLP
jgi:hypothetical protein